MPGKCKASGYVSKCEITVCRRCLHKDVCGDKDYLSENSCPFCIVNHTEDGTEIFTVDEIKELARAKQDGRLVVLPCKVGDKVYRINRNTRDKRYGVHEEHVTALRGIMHINGIIRDLEDVFLTQEAAEAALKEREQE